MQCLHGALLHLRLLPRRGVHFLLSQFLAGRGLVFLDNLVGDRLHERVLLRAGEANTQQQRHEGE